jgi:hypothetical protein
MTECCYMITVSPPSRHPAMSPQTPTGARIRFARLPGRRVWRLPVGDTTAGLGRLHPGRVTVNSEPETARGSSNGAPYRDTILRLL